ncbi:MAG: 50S ribosomal protein L25 [Thermoanaerobaculia bacterium]
MNEVTVEVQPRAHHGSSGSRRTRREGLIPAVVYGGGKETISIQVPRKILIDLFKEGGHENRIFLLKMAGTDQQRHVMIRDLQIDPLTRQVAHIDFQRILMDQKVRVKVHLQLEGLAHGVKNDGGILDFVTREIEVECLPGAIPHEIKVDVSGLQINQHLEIKDIVIPEGVTLIGERDRVVAAVAHARIEAEATPAVAAPVAAETTEPEVIKRGKTEEASAT